MPQRSFAVFDIDGTLIRWQLYHALADNLVKLGAIDSKEYEKVLQARRNWKNRRAVNSFNDYETAMIGLVSRSLPNMAYDTFAKACVDVFSRYQDQVYSFTRDLITELRQQNYLLFAVSGSPDELVSMVADYYSFDDYAGTVYEVLNGRLSGKYKTMLNDTKAKSLKHLIAKHGATKTGSIGVGDTASDSGMLNLAERAIAFNPSRELFQIAANFGWDIIIERKNMVYRLKYTHGQYVLADTNERQTAIF